MLLLTRAVNAARLAHECGEEADRARAAWVGERVRRIAAAPRVREPVDNDATHGERAAGVPVVEPKCVRCAGLDTRARERGRQAIVDAGRIAALNTEHRGKDGPTDVLSFPIDEDGASHGPRELGDVVICPDHTADLREAIVHGVLHLTGMDHEADDGEMLALQAEIMGWMK